MNDRPGDGQNRGVTEPQRETVTLVTEGLFGIGGKHMITKEKFGQVYGEDVYCYSLKNKNGMEVRILNYGGILKNIFVPDREQKPTDVILGRDTLEEYIDNDGYLGALIGRCGNRIAKGKFAIDGADFQVGVNDGENSLHGGIHGFNEKIWMATESGTKDEPSLILSIVSPAGEEGYPGTLRVDVVYTLTAQNGLVIHYEAVSDEKTVVNLTNHAYFNVNGCHAGSAEELTLWMDSDFYTPNGADCMPNGEVHSVSGTPFDFRMPKKLGQDMDSDFDQIKLFGGYDHNMILAGNGFRRCAELYGEKSGIAMEMYTDLPGVQLYTSNALSENRNGKDGLPHKKHQGVCLETQYVPNAVNYPQFASPVLEAGEIYRTTTEYRFMIK